MAGKNILVMHGGGPTAVINASLYGIVAEGKLHGEIAHIYGAHGGPSGLVNGTLIDLGAMPDSELVRLRDAPGTIRPWWSSSSRTVSISLCPRAATAP